LIGISITRGKAAGYGGGVDIFGSSTVVHLTRCQISSCEARAGGGVSIREATVTADSCLISDNTAAVEVEFSLQLDMTDGQRRLLTQEPSPTPEPSPSPQPSPCEEFVGLVNIREATPPQACDHLNSDPTRCGNSYVTTSSGHFKRCVYISEKEMCDGAAESFDCMPRAVGGGLFARGGKTVLTNTLISENMAPMGANVYRSEGLLYYTLPMVPGHWLPFTECVVNREACSNSNCVATRAQCSLTSGTGPDWQPEIISGHKCNRPSTVQTCDWKTDACATGSSDCLLGKQLYLAPNAPIDGPFPRPCHNVDCPNGTWRRGSTCDSTSGEGYECVVCSGCGAGQYELSPCKKTADRTCQPVSEGYWSAEGDNKQRQCFNTNCPTDMMRMGVCDSTTGTGFTCVCSASSGSVCPTYPPKCVCRMKWQDGCAHPVGAGCHCED